MTPPFPDSPLSDHDAHNLRIHEQSMIKARLHRPRSTLPSPIGYIRSQSIAQRIQLDSKQLRYAPFAGSYVTHILTDSKIFSEKTHFHYIQKQNGKISILSLFHDPYTLSV